VTAWRRILAVLAALPLAAAAPCAFAQPAPGKHRVGVLIPATTPDLAEFRKALQELGYEEGGNLELDVRIAGDRLDKLSTMAAEIVRASPEVVPWRDFSKAGFTERYHGPHCLSTMGLISRLQSSSLYSLF